MQRNLLVLLSLHRAVGFHRQVCSSANADLEHPAVLPNASAFEVCRLQAPALCKAADPL